MSIQSSPTLLAWFCLNLLIVGIILLLWGRKMPARGVWLVWVALLLVGVGLGVETGLFGGEAFHPKLWVSGWILAREDSRAITVGIYQDLLSLVVLGLGSITGGGLLLCGGAARSEHPQRSYGAIAISICGISLAGLAVTSWLSMAALFLTILGGALAFGAHWASDEEARIAGRFIWERSLGLLIALAGACLLASAGCSLLLNQTESWATHGGFHSANIGAGMLLLGLFIQMQPFPFLGWAILDSKTHPTQRLILAQVLPAWCAFLLILRLGPQFESVGLFPGFGVLALLSGFLSMFAGLFQKRGFAAQSLWTTAGFSISTAMVAFGGSLSGMALMVGVTLSAMALSCATSHLDPARKQLSAQGMTWTKALTLTAVAMGTGLLGSLSAAGSLEWLVQAVEVPWIVSIFFGAHFLFVLLGWVIAWRVFKTSGDFQKPPVEIITTVLWLLCSLGVFWTGSPLSHGLIPQVELLFPSLLGLLFPASEGNSIDPSVWMSVAGFYWGAFLVGAAVAYWICGRKEDRLETLISVFPRTARFIGSGYRTEWIGEKWCQSLIWIGTFAQWMIDKKIWSDWIPRGTSVSLLFVSKGFLELDAKLTAGIGETLRRSVEVPGKMLQLLQTGDIRWYLFISLSASFSLLAHFLR